MPNGIHHPPIEDGRLLPNSVKVLFNSSKVKTNFDSAVTSIEEIQKAIENVGYPVLKAKVKAV
ncbi:heavy-metal-associated domain-containing protein [Enterococcus faecium]|uniref:heavy-metal-associated domain-containing protein n=1 Tax=Enterococcus faecium TaxID=1352 RepID=UPI001EE79986|nr:metal-binding protein [Enterococcus faecium]